jgi:bifunctional UDP-N-acetylglucosamine pyrophosphorylase/glucosamine-1-phosphate N-acetyltransferase
MRAGVTMVDPARTYVDATVELEPDVRLLPGTFLEGRTVIGGGSVIGPDARLTDVVVGERARVSNTVARESEIGDHCEIGPYAYLRPGTRLAAGVKVGTYVEVKNSEIGEGTKVPHLSYIGDADIGAGVNLGASTITANYDGTNKYRTTIRDGVHTGVHTSLVAPVELGDGADTGAGSVVTHDVPEGRHVRGVPARDTRPVREDEG